MSRPSASAVRDRRIAALTAIALTVALVAVALGASGPAAEPEPSRPFTVGVGAKSALVLPGRGGRLRPTIVFLHGWGLIGSNAYQAWLRHLTARGSTVIVPRYQTSLGSRSERVSDDALAGIRGALRRLRQRPRGVVVVGHSVGGVLALDYAARARALRLPAALAVMSIFPGAALRDMPPVAYADPASLPSTVRRLVVLESPADSIVGTSLAEDIYAGATSLPADRRELVTIRDPAAGDHFAPVIDAPAARRAFWTRLDRLVASVS